MSKRRKSIRRNAGRMVSLLAALAPFCVTTAHAEDTKVYGDVSAAFSWNTQNTLKDNLLGSNVDTKGKLSMARFTLKLNVDSTINDSISWAGKFRLVKDASTSYLRQLDKLGADTAGHNDLSRWYSEGEIRELYVDYKPTSDVLLRVGKQQVVWGESDFFQAMDMVHGYDFTWRSFLEPANEDLRKPSVMANLTVQIPELNGKIQALVRPGSWNRDETIGNTFDLRGGRWANQPLKGIDFLTITPYNYRVEGADAQKDTWGLRWSGMANEINYSLSYLKTFNPVPVLSMSNNAQALFGAPVAVPTGATPFDGRTPSGIAGEVLYPEISLFGLTASGYSEWADAVFSGEAAFIRDFAYNHGQTSLWSAVLGGPGYDGVKRKNVVRSMLRMDKNLAFTQSLLGTEKPAFFSVQLFDTWIRDFKSDEDLVQLVGFGQRSKEHSSLITFIFEGSYSNGTVVPSIVAGRDLSYGGGFIVPSVSFQFGKDWRLKLEYDHFLTRGERTPANNNVESNTGLFGYFANNNQFYAKVTYQF